MFAWLVELTGVPCGQGEAVPSRAGGAATLLVPARGVQPTGEHWGCPGNAKGNVAAFPDLTAGLGAGLGRAGQSRELLGHWGGR